MAAQTGIPSLTTKGVQALRNEHGEPADILPLLPLQQGLLFHVRTDSTVGRYNSLTSSEAAGGGLRSPAGPRIESGCRSLPAARFDSENAPQPVQILPLAWDERLRWPLTCVTLDPYKGVEVALARNEQEELG
ncbi:MAG: hypothetical protein G5701_05930 [Serratia symbiotica]|nr:hypothetical protein [Serratia symbiotica]